VISRSGPDYFSREAFPIFQAAFRQLEKSPPYDLGRFFAEVFVRALVLCARFDESLSLAATERPAPSLVEDERIAQFVRMLDRAEASAASERAGQIELRHVLRAAFEELTMNRSALVNASSPLRPESVAATCLQLRDRAFERYDVIHRVEAAEAVS
jgi:hypothetical protein